MPSMALVLSETTSSAIIILPLSLTVAAYAGPDQSLGGADTFRLSTQAASWKAAADQVTDFSFSQAYKVNQHKYHLYHSIHFNLERGQQCHRTQYSTLRVGTALQHS